MAALSEISPRRDLLREFEPETALRGLELAAAG
jgi:hypothetical protein